MRKKQKKQYTLEELYNPQIDLNRDAYLYGRQSSKDQVLTNIQSHISQTIRLLEYTKGLGFKDDSSTGSVTLFVENQVVDADGNISIKNASGTWPIDRRPGLKTISDLIASGKCGVVISEFVDRLFRDEDRIDSNVFIKICREHDCFVHIESKRMTYNFANLQHAELFRLEVQMAAAYIENHVRGTMLRRRSLAGRSGLWAGLGSVPVGYIIDKNEDRKTYGKFIIYEPHARVVKWIFVRFVELGCDFYKLCKELREIPCLFPPFEPGVFTKSSLKLRTSGGYVISSEDALRNLLTNVAYIGVWKAEGVNKPNNHEPIIDEALFWMVYDRLKSTRPDGTPTGKIPLVRYTQEKSLTARQPLLKHLIATPAHYTLSTKTQRYYYELLSYGTLTRKALLSVEANEFERIVIKRLFQTLRVKKIGDLKEARKQREKEKNKRLDEIEREYQTIEEEVETLLTNLGKTKTDAVVQKIEAKIAKLLERQTNLVKERDALVHEYASIQLGTLEEELQNLEELWGEKSFEAKRGLVSLLIKKIIWQYMSPRFFKLRIVWAYKEWGVDEAIFDRRNIGSKLWTGKEREILARMYPACEQADILQALPIRSWRCITVEASKLGLRRRGKPALLEMNLSYHDLQFLAQSGLTLADFSDCNQTSWSLRGAGHA